MPTSLLEGNDYPLLHQVDLMTVWLKTLAEGGSTQEDALRRLHQNLKAAGEKPPVPDADLRDGLSHAAEHLCEAGAIAGAPLESGAPAYAITPRGSRLIAAHPGGVDGSVLSQFPEYRSYLKARRAGEAESGRHPGDALVQRRHDEGYTAYIQGLGHTANPYDVDTAEYHAWQDGWFEGRDEDQHFGPS